MMSNPHGFATKSTHVLSREWLCIGKCWKIVDVNEHGRFVEGRLVIPDTLSTWARFPGYPSPRGLPLPF